MYVCMYVNMCIYIYVYTHIYIYIYIYNTCRPTWTPGPFPPPSATDKCIPRPIMTLAKCIHRPKAIYRLAVVHILILTTCRMKRRIREKPEKNQDMIGSDEYLDQRIPSVFCADTCWSQAICKRSAPFLDTFVRSRFLLPTSSSEIACNVM